MDRVGKKQGFTLIELVIAIVVIGICFISVMSLFTQALQNNVINEITTVATSLAEGKMEEVIQDGFTGVSDESGNFPSPFPDYSYQISCNYVNSSNLDTSVAGPTEYKKVDVIVSHNLIGNVTLTTLLSDYED